MSTATSPGRLLTALLTPCDPHTERVDLDAVAALVEYQVARGVDGLFLLGTAGQGPLLEPAERRSVLEAAVAAADGRIAVVCHVGASTTRATLDLVEHAANAGVAAVASVPPPYYAPDRRAVDAYYRTLVDRSPVPVFAYDNPPATGYTFRVNQIADLVEAGLAGVKVATADVGYLQRLCWAGIPVWTANADLNLAGHCVGARGVISTITNLAPELFIQLRTAVDDGDLSAASALQRRVTTFAGVVRRPVLGGLHFAAAVLGQPAGAPRRPPRPPEPGERAAIVRALECEGLA